MKTMFLKLLEVAKKGEDINLSLQTLSEMANIEEVLKPYGYKISNISSYKGLSQPNCLFIKIKENENS